MMTLNEISAKLQTQNLRKLAREIGLPYDTVRNAKLGKNINYEAGRKLAEFLGK